MWSIRNDEPTSRVTCACADARRSKSRAVIAGACGIAKRRPSFRGAQHGVRCETKRELLSFEDSGANSNFTGAHCRRQTLALRVGDDVARDLAATATSLR